MEARQEENTHPEEQVSIWSVCRELFIAYFVMFSLLFALVSGIAAWLSYISVNDIRDAAELAMTAMGLASGRILWLAAFSIITVEVGNVIVEYLIVDRYRRGKEAGREEGETGERSRWRAWYQRQQAAFREGRPFDEPPPGDEGNGK